MELRFKAGSWQATGIPETGCRIRRSAFERILERGGYYDADDLIFGLMDWLDVTDDPGPPSIILQSLLDRHYPADGKTTGRCQFVDEYGADRIFHVGPIDINAPMLAWQRRDWVFAVAQPSSEPGRIVVGAPRPISLSTASRILNTSVVQYMGEPHDSFVGALATANSTGAYYRWEAHEVTPIGWLDGLSRSALATGLDKDRIEREWLPPHQVAIQVGIAEGYKAT